MTITSHAPPTKRFRGRRCHEEIWLTAIGARRLDIWWRLGVEVAFRKNRDRAALGSSDRRFSAYGGRRRPRRSQFREYLNQYSGFWSGRAGVRQSWRPSEGRPVFILAR